MNDHARRVPLVDLQSQYAELRGRIAERIDKVLVSGAYILGPEVAEFEAAFAEFTGARHAIGVANGTDALLIPLLEAGIGPGDAVFVPALTFVATAEVVALAGATPVFVDVDEARLTMDPADLEARIDAVVRAGQLRPRAVIPVDLLGLPADYGAIGVVAERHGCLVIADAAQSTGGAVSSRRVGTLADITATSFYPSKPLGCYGDGGCILVDDDQRAERIRRLHVHGLEPGRGAAVAIGLNSRLDTLQAAILLEKLAIFDRELQARQAVAARYAEALADLVQLQAIPRGYSSAFAVYAIRLDERDALRALLDERGIVSVLYYATPLHLQPAYRHWGDGPGSLPVSEHFGRTMLALPMSAGHRDGPDRAFCSRGQRRLVGEYVGDEPWLGCR